MKKMTVVVFLVVAFIVGVSAVNNADAGLYQRIEYQQQRINEGLAHGKLTQQEANILQDNLAWIRSKFERAWFDGMLNRAEYARIERLLDENSQMIYKKKHNAIRPYR